MPYDEKVRAHGTVIQASWSPDAAENVRACVNAVVATVRAAHRQALTGDMRFRWHEKFRYVFCEDRPEVNVRVACGTNENPLWHESIQRRRRSINAGPKSPPLTSVLYRIF